MKPKPKIVALPNGPYYLITNSEPVEIPNLQNAGGKALSTVTGVALCRCGQSKNKPFCDGTHSVVGFSSKVIDESRNAKDKRKNYVGSNNKITIHDNRAICAHAKECIKNHAVFNDSARPWINPDGATIESIIQTVKDCPSGALSYSIDGIEYRDQDRQPMVTVARDGPYAITGGIELSGDNVRFGEGASKEHYTLCRCGASNNKPFCDGSHHEIHFKDGS
jgi:CDGSH-type Zn-finger protein